MSKQTQTLESILSNYIKTIVENALNNALTGDKVAKATKSSSVSDKKAKTATPSTKVEATPKSVKLSKWYITFEGKKFVRLGDDTKYRNGTKADVHDYMLAFVLKAFRDNELTSKKCSQIVKNDEKLRKFYAENKKALKHPSCYETYELLVMSEFVSVADVRNKSAYNHLRDYFTDHLKKEISHY